MDFTTGLDTGSRPTGGADDQRSAPRFTSLIRAAKLVCGQGEFVCVIRDVSSSGVSLRTFHRLPTDHALALELQNGESYELQQVRSRGFEGSYRFVNPIAVEKLIKENWQFPKRQLRLNIMMPLTIASLTGSAQAITLNVSQQGARVECDHVFAIDQRVKLRSKQYDEIRAVVRWRKDANYGLAFEDTFSLQAFGLLAAKVQCPLLLKDEH